MYFRDAQKSIKRSQPITTTNTLGYNKENATKTIDDDMSGINLHPSNSDNALSTAKTADQFANQKLQQHLSNIALSAQ